MTYQVRTEVFEGPFDLLLSLIEKRKLFINDISLSAVTDDYIRHVEEMEAYPIKDTAHFILIASTLLLIKSRSLLPSLPLTEEEQGSIAELEDRLVRYKEIKRLSEYVKEAFGLRRMFSRRRIREETPVFTPDPAITVDTMLTSVRNAIAQIPKEEPIAQTTVRKVVSLEQAIENLTQRVARSLRTSFRELSGGGKTERTIVVVHFIALLELVKRGVIAVKQSQHFDDIDIETEDVGVPRYD